MRSAYLVLGVPGDASPEEIETAWHRSERQFTRERLAQEEGALARLHDLKAAYQVLRDPDARAAHDRKLQAAARPAIRPRTVIVQAEESSPLRRMMMAGFLLLVVVFGAAAAVHWRTAQVRKEQAALEAAAQKAAAQESARVRAEQERADARRAAAAAQAQAAEHRLIRDAQVSAAVAAANARTQEASEAFIRRQQAAELQRQDATRAYEERRTAAEARIRVERDKQRVRELCMQQYRRPDC